MKQLFILTIVICYALSQEQWQVQYRAFDQDVITNLDGWNAQNVFKQKTISTCGKQQLVGGFEVFGKRATITKQVRVPPHFKLKIQVQLWRIDSWDNEKMQIYIDGFLWEAKWGFSDGGTSLCRPVARNDKFTQKVYDVEFTLPHNSPTVTIIMTSTLDEDASNESWGFRDFRLSYISCPKECGICFNNKPEECQNWEQAAFSWAKPDVSVENWDLQNGYPRAMKCSGVNIFGGQNNIGKGSVLSKIFPSLPPHYKVLFKFQFWKIDSWDNEQLRVSVDQNLAFTQNFQWNEGVELCGTDVGKNQGEGWAEKVVNVEFQLPHSSPSVKFSMTSTLDEGMDNESWAIRDFFLFVGKCSAHCLSCTGPNATDCLQCEPTFSIQEGICKDSVQWIVAIKDFTGNAKYTDTKGWDFQNFITKNPFSNCGDELTIAGGVDKFVAGTMAIKQVKLPSHQRIRIKAQLWKIDAWQGEEMYIRIGEQKIFAVNLGFNDPGQQNSCGRKTTNWNERVIEVDRIIESGEQIVRIEIGTTLDKESLDQSWGFRDFLLLYEATEECITFFSQCNFQGRSFEFCQNSPSFQAVNNSKLIYKSRIDMPIKSIRIPDGTSLVGFSDESYKGGKVEFTESQECISNYDFSMFQTGQSMRLNGQLKLKMKSKQLI